MVKDTFGIQFIGTQRSGSNLLRVMLNQLKEISAPHPPHILKTFYPLLPLYGDLRLRNSFQLLIKDVCDWVNNNPVKWSSMELNPLEVESICEEHSLVEIFWRIYQLKAQADNAKFWCCKSMENVYFLNELESFGLKPFYIFLYRDGRDVALSFTKAIVGPKHLYQLALKWKKEQQMALDFLDSIDKGRYLTVQYETFIQTPEFIMRELCKKLQIDYADLVFDFFKSEESKNTASAGAMWRNVTSPVIDNNFNKFESAFSGEDLMLFESVAGEMLNKLNYKPQFWPEIKNNLFSEQQIKEFEIHDNLLKEAAYKNANPEEVKRRLNQEKILDEIKSRNKTLV